MKSRLSVQRISFTLITVTATALLAACSGSSTSAPTTSPAGAATSSTAPESAAVSIALSWTPNTDYTGVYVAQRRGYYRDAGIELTILPYASTAPEALISSGKADFGFSYQAGVAYARAAGQDVVAVFAPNQKGTYAIGVAANRSDLRSPKDLDGKTYAGFGSPDELPLLTTIIRADGGKGEFTNVTLNTSAYEALAIGAADFTIPVVTWQGVEAKAAGRPMKFFALTDYGFPDQYSVLIASSRAYLDANTDVASRFLRVTQRGYADAAADPEAAARDMVAEDPGAFPNQQLVVDSQRALADGGYLTDAQGRVGYQSQALWEAYGGFLWKNNLLIDASGAGLTSEPNWSAAFTNEYLE
jgi:ABC-type nitrate/sulfonate/bicarbonate transport system substrate-binding protein